MTSWSVSSGSASNVSNEALLRPKTLPMTSGELQMTNATVEAERETNGAASKQLRLGALHRPALSKVFWCSLRKAVPLVPTVRRPFQNDIEIEGSLGTGRVATLLSPKLNASWWWLRCGRSSLTCLACNCTTSARGDGTRAARDSLASPAATARSRRRRRVLRRLGLGVCVAGGIPPSAPRDDEEPDRAGEPTEEDLQPRLDGAATPG
eukprot:scaffold15730_cov65-Phaeocystis_antarctica.AAC.1